MVWAFYPETANRTLEEMDLLFASKSPFVWDEERNFQRLKAQMEETGRGIGDVVDGSEGDVVEEDAGKVVS